MCMNFLAIIIAGLSFLVAVASAVFAWRAIRQSKKTVLEKKRVDIRELQPRIRVWARSGRSGDNIPVKIHLQNLGHSSALDIKISITGSDRELSIEKLNPALTYNGKLWTKTEEIVLHPDEELLKEEIKELHIKVSYHDKWYPEIQYPEIRVPFEQKRQPENDAIKYMPVFGDKLIQVPPVEYAFQKYSNNEIIKIWEKEFV